MGRKIPGKKHHGTKFPAQQQRVRQESLKHKINCPPEDIDEQPLPSNLQKIAQWKKLDNQKLSKSQLRKGDIFKSWLLGKPEDVTPENGQKIRPSPTSKTSSWATDKKSVLNQVVDVNEELINEYKRSHSDSNKPKQETKKRKGEIDQIIMNAGGKLRKKKAKGGEEQTSKKEKMKVRLAAKKQARVAKMQERQDEKDILVDVVEFGEVVDAPPNLSLPSKNKVKHDAKPGQRGLLLKQFLPTKHKIHTLKLKKNKEERRSNISS